MPATTWWSVLVEFAAAEVSGGPLATQDERFDLFADAVEEHDGVVGGGGTNYSVRLSVLAEDAAVAAMQGRDVAWKAARRSDLPEWPCVRLEAVEQETLATELEGETLPQLVGAAEVARMLDVSRQRLAELRNGKADFPRPIADLASGPVWLRPAITLWAAGWERRPGRPRGAAQTVGVAAVGNAIAANLSTSLGRGVTMAGGKKGGGSKGGGKIGRSATTGRFVKQSTVKRHPDKTVNESRGKSK